MRHNQQPIDKYRRECENRTKSERDIDRFLLADQFKKLKNQENGVIAQHDKILEKRMKLNNGLQLNIKKEVEEKDQEFPLEQEQNKQKEQNVQNNQKKILSTDEVFERIVRSFQKGGQKLEKGLEMFEKLLLNELRNDNLVVNQWLSGFWELYRVKYELKKINFVKVNEIFLNFDKLIQEELIKPDNLEAQFWEIFKFWGLGICSFYQEDSFSFNGCIVNLKKQIDQLEKDQQELKEKQYIEEQLKKQKQGETEQEKQQKQEKDQKEEENSKFCLDKFLNSEENKLNLVREILFSGIIESVNFFKHEWAKTSVRTLVSDSLLIKQHVWNEQQIEILNDTMDRISKQQNEDKLNIKRRDILDKSILSEAQNSKNKVVDSREVKVVFGDGLGKWGNKQNGI